MHKAFYRPTTKVNLVLERFLQLPSSIDITREDIKRWQKDSMAAYKSLGFSTSFLNRVVLEPKWRLSADVPPSNVWFGEAKFNGAKTPEVILYKKSSTSALKPKFLRNMAGQAGMDHLFGHLYVFYEGGMDYGEEVACCMQWRAALSRKTFLWQLTAYLIPIIYKFHKEIPLSNYR